MADERWTADVEAAATCALWEHGHLGEPLDDITRRDEPAAVAFTRGAVRAVLDSLGRLGVLVAPGGETRQDIEQRGYQRAVDALRESAEDYDEEVAHCRKMATNGFAAPEVTGPAGARADYLERLAATVRACADFLEAREVTDDE